MTAPFDSGTSDPLRDRQMRDLICRLNLLSCVPASAASPTGGPATDEHPGGRLPKGGGQDGRDWWDRYLQDPDVTVKAAEDYLEHAQHSKGQRTVEESPQQLTGRIRDLIAQGWTIKEVAMHCRCTPTRVRQATASPVESARERADAAEVLRLKAQDPGRTVRFIAARTGMAKSTVQDILRRAA